MDAVDAASPGADADGTSRPLPVRLDLGQVAVQLQNAYDLPLPTSANQSGFRDQIHACWLLRQGAVTVRHGAGRLIARAGQWVLIPAGMRRDQRFTADTRLLSVRFSAERRDGRPLLAAAGQPLVLAEAAVPELRPAGEAVVATLPAPGLAGACARAAALATFFARWLAVWDTNGMALADSDGDPRLNAALEVLERHGRLAPAPWPELRAATRWSRAQCDRVFRSRLGISPAQWLDRRQRQRADALLADPALAVKTIAHRLGFSDPSHFARWYRRGAGIPPAAARRPV